MAVTPVEPLTVQDLRTRLRLNTDEDDELLAEIITEARLYVERVSGKSLYYQTRVQVFEDERPRGAVSGHVGHRPLMRLHYPPIVSVDKVEGYDIGLEAWVELAAEDYIYEAETHTVLLLNWPLGLQQPADLYRVTYTAGYATREEMPADLTMAVRRYAVWSFDRPSGSQPPDLNISFKHYL